MMLEQEVKEIVEKICRLEGESEDLISVDNFGEAGACTREAVRLEESLEQAGITLGNDGEDVIVYQRIGRSSVSEEWMRFDAVKWLWKDAQDEQRTV